MPSYKGEYAPEDQREVTLNKSDLAIEPERTGPQEESTRNEQDSETAAQDGSAEAVAAQQAGADSVIVGETSDRPDLRARADASPPVTGGS